MPRMRRHFEGLPSDGGEDHNCTGLTDISDCPFNFWRTTGDPEPDWGTVMRELNSLRKVDILSANACRPCLICSQFVVILLSIFLSLPRQHLPSTCNNCCIFHAESCSFISYYNACTVMIKVMNPFYGNGKRSGSVDYNDADPRTRLVRTLSRLVSISAFWGSCSRG